MSREPVAESAGADRLYDAFGYAALAAAALASPYLLWRGLGRGLGQRLGRLPPELRHLKERPVWVHAASVGETLSAVPLVVEIRRRLPGVPIVTSSTTLTGQETARQEIRPDALTLLPIDPAGVIDRVLRRVRPRCVILVETEIWPGLIASAHRQEIPVAMVSGSLSERSARRYRLVAKILRTTLARIAAFGMQTEADAERIVRLGAARERVVVTGSLKEAPRGESPSAAWMRSIVGRPLLLGASTQPGEEELLIDACTGFWNEHPRLLLVLAPRRPERFEAVARLVAESGLRYERRSAVGDEVGAETQVLLVDSLGELKGLLPLATAAFVGGSIAPLGGHNVMEPAACGVPVSFGPNLDNVTDAATRLIDAKGGIVVRTADELGRHWWHLLSHPDEAGAMGVRARGVAGAGSGSLERTMRLLDPILCPPGGDATHGTAVAGKEKD